MKTMSVLMLAPALLAMRKWELQVALDGSRIIKTERKKPGDTD